MRNDAIGFFWDDTPPPKPPKATPEKRTPPKPTWLEPSYLPGLEEALRFPVHVMTDTELYAAQQAGEVLINDDEVFPNYFLAMFTSLKTGWVTYVEAIEGQKELDTGRLRWLLENFQTVGFNSETYDMTMNALALAGCTTRQIKECSDKLIIENVRPGDILRAASTKKLKVDHIDLIEVAPLDASLKTYGGRLHVPKLQELPFHPSTVLNDQQIAIVRWYCCNDCTSTAFLHEHLKEHLELRNQFGKQYDIDLRSHSDAQMAEEVIRQEIKKVTGQFPKKPKYGASIGMVFKYKPPAYVEFASRDLQNVLHEMSSATIEVGPTGHAVCPPEIRQRTVTIAGKKYKVGMGGLHSMEKRQAVVSNEYQIVADRDVTGYYPNLILHNGFAPPSLGNIFLTAFGRMVRRRTDSKREFQAIEKRGGPFDMHFIAVKTDAEGLKIANNGIFGKLSDPFSTVYDTPNMVQVTLTGQLSLLMAIEALEAEQIPVVSANTDGIVVACPRAKYPRMCEIFKAWEARTGLETEETEYAAIYSRDVNNYIALKPDRKTKTKGAYCERGSAHNSVLSKNPEALICSDAAQKFIANGTPVEETILACKDIRRFVTVRVVNGGGVKVWGDDHNEYLGKTVRWYYAKNVPGVIVYAKTGNNVPRSEGAKPCMELPKQFPDDIDYDWYIAFANRILYDIGVLAEPVASKEDPSYIEESSTEVSHV